MDSWNGNLRGFVFRPESSFSFINHHNCDQPFPGMEITKHRAMAETRGGMEKKKRLESDQLESLERSFEEEIKLDPERKMKLSRELGLQPRQIAVWFQNRRARWKTKQLQRLYDVLRHEYAVIYMEKQKLQDEVLKLKAILREEVVSKKVSTVYAEISGSSRVREASHHRMIDEGSYVFNVNEYNASVLPTCWSVLPSCPPC